jgi:hypothetical protein
VSKVLEKYQRQLGWTNQAKEMIQEDDEVKKSLKSVRG